MPSADILLAAFSTYSNWWWHIWSEHDNYSQEITKKQFQWQLMISRHKHILPSSTYMEKNIYYFQKEKHSKKFQLIRDNLGVT